MAGYVRINPGDTEPTIRGIFPGIAHQCNICFGVDRGLCPGTIRLVDMGVRVRVVRPMAVVMAMGNAGGR